MLQLANQQHMRSYQIPLFVQGYLIVMKGKEETIRARMATNLEELMSDAALYGWERVRVHHRVWLNKAGAIPSHVTAAR